MQGGIKIYNIDWSLGPVLGRNISVYTIGSKKTYVLSFSWDQAMFTSQCIYHRTSVRNMCRFIVEIDIYFWSYFKYTIAVFFWWRHQMETFLALLALCLENSPINGEFPPQRPVTWSFDVFFDLRLNKWYASHLRRHCDHYDVSVMSMEKKVLLQ